MSSQEVLHLFLRLPLSGQSRIVVTAVIVRRPKDLTKAFDIEDGEVQVNSLGNLSKYVNRKAEDEYVTFYTVITRYENRGKTPRKLARESTKYRVPRYYPHYSPEPANNDNRGILSGQDDASPPLPQYR